MRREQCRPRDNWQEKVAKRGLTYHTLGGKPYWDESASYHFGSREIDVLERATNELHAMCLAAAGHVIANKRYAELGIPELAVPLIERSWEEEPPSLYGRFDFGYDGKNPPKLFEYNADTPTALIEAAVTQWDWQEEYYGDGVVDQFNSIHDRLIAKWRDILPTLPSKLIHFGYLDNPEDWMTVAYLMDTAQQAGATYQALVLEQVHWDPLVRAFVDQHGMLIQSFFKLYPWEWLVAEGYAQYLAQSLEKTRWIEPPWKMLLSNKGLLPILWELYPEHPNLLPAYRGGPRDLVDFVKKPIHSREGANIELYRNRSVRAATDGPYANGAFVCQALYELPSFDGNVPVIGSWVIDGEAAGIGIRESDGPITNNSSRFVPHIIV